MLIANIDNLSANAPFGLKSAANGDEQLVGSVALVSARHGTAHFLSFSTSTSTVPVVTVLAPAQLSVARVLGFILKDSEDKSVASQRVQHFF